MVLHTSVRCVQVVRGAVHMRDAIVRIAIVRRCASWSRTDGVTRSAVHTRVGCGVTHNVKSCLRCISWPHINDRRSATSGPYLHPSAQSCARAPRATMMHCTCNASTTTLQYGVASCPHRDACLQWGNASLRCEAHCHYMCGAPLCAGSAVQ